LIQELFYQSPRFHAAMHCLPGDRAPVADFGFWDEAIVIWQDQGWAKEIKWQR
jgi:hypothetical protein